MSKTGSRFQKNDPRINRQGRKKTYSQEVLDFIKENCKTMLDAELSEAVNRRFNLNTSKKKIKMIRGRYKIITGRGKPFPTFTEITDHNTGYVKIKNAAGKWVCKHRFLYEQAHGKIPEEYSVIFLDGNINNFNLDNLMLVTRGEKGSLSKIGLRFNNPDLTKTGIAFVKHKNAIKARIDNLAEGKHG